MKESFINCPPNGSSSCIYILGVIGSSIYFISNATDFWAGVLGLLKAMVWPAYLTFYAFKNLGV